MAVLTSEIFQYTKISSGGDSLQEFSREYAAHIADYQSDIEIVRRYVNDMEENVTVWTLGSEDQPRKLLDNWRVPRVNNISLEWNGYECMKCTVCECDTNFTARTVLPVNGEVRTVQFRYCSVGLVVDLTRWDVRYNSGSQSVQLVYDPDGSYVLKDPEAIDERARF